VKASDRHQVTSNLIIIDLPNQIYIGSASARQNRINPISPLGREAKNKRGAKSNRLKNVDQVLVANNHDGVPKLWADHPSWTTHPLSDGVTLNRRKSTKVPENRQKSTKNNEN
jgi:hypothetical protein